MTTTTWALRVGGSNDIDLVAAVVADAFGFLEVIRWLVPEPGRRWEVFAGFVPARGIGRGAHGAATSSLSSILAERTAR